MSKIGGTQVNVGIGIETTPGTPVSATVFPKWTELSLQGVSEKTMLKAARGIRNESSDSRIRRKYSKGSLGVVPNVKNAAPLFYLGLGTLQTAGPTDSAYTHTITPQDANASMKAATVITEQGSEVTERFSNVVANSLNLEVADDYGKLTADLLGGFPDTSTLSESFTKPTEFAYSDYTATFGTSFSNALGTAASATLTSDTTAPADGATVVIGAVTYTFKTTLTNSGNTPYEVLIGADAAAALDNLKAAINAASGAGTTYGIGTLAHPLVIATTNTDTTQLIVARVNGTAANSIATTQAGTSHCSWDGATMNSGTPGTGPAATPLRGFTLNINNNVLLDEAFLSGAVTPVAGGFVAGRLQISGSYTLQFSGTVELDKYKANTKNALIVTFIGAVIGSSSFEKLTIKLGKLILTSPPKEYNLDGLVMLKQEFTVEHDPTDGVITVEVVNDVASY